MSQLTANPPCDLRGSSFLALIRGGSFSQKTVTFRSVRLHNPSSGADLAPDQQRPVRINQERSPMTNGDSGRRTVPQSIAGIPSATEHSHLRRLASQPYDSHQSASSKPPSHCINRSIGLDHGFADKHNGYDPRARLRIIATNSLPHSATDLNHPQHKSMSAAEDGPDPSGSHQTRERLVHSNAVAYTRVTDVRAIHARHLVHSHLSQCGPA